MENSNAGLADAFMGAAKSAAGEIPWFCRLVVFGAACILIGIVWDISWHSTIGRDTFWTPAHMVIYLGGSLGGLCCGWEVLKTTFRGTPEARSMAVRLWGFRGPLGAWISIWGALAMLTSAPFDNWWHDAYGLDVKIISPPHTVLAAGMHGVVLGALVLMLSHQNRSAGERQNIGSGWFVFAGGVMLSMASVLVTEYSWPNKQHTALFYKVSCGLYPLVLVAVARASKLRWAATISASVYMLLLMAMVWILPLFAATPKLGPIYNPVDHMVPPPFPRLMLVPAIAIDLFFWWLGRGRGWRRDLLLVGGIGASFASLFLAVQWQFAKFFLTPAANNWIFAGNGYWGYNAGSGSWRTEFWDVQQDPVNWRAFGWMLLLAWFSTGLGLLIGNGMAKVKR